MISDMKIFIIFIPDNFWSTFISFFIGEKWSNFWLNFLFLTTIFLIIRNILRSNFRHILQSILQIRHFNQLNVVILIVTFSILFDVHLIQLICNFLHHFFLSFDMGCDYFRRDFELVLPFVYRTIPTISTNFWSNRIKNVDHFLYFGKLAQRQPKTNT